MPAGRGGPRILLVRTSALGDVVHCLPVLRALRRALPTATLGWVVEAVFAPILAGHPDLDAVIPVRLRAWRGRGLIGRRREIVAARRALRGFRADVALDLMGNHKGAALARLSGARRVLGAQRRDRREPSSALWLSDTVPTRGAHAVDRALSLLDGLGVERGPTDFGGDVLLPQPGPTFAAWREARDERPLVLLQLGAGWANKIWPMERWAALAQRLAAAGCDVWIPSAPGEEDLAERVAHDADGAARIVDATDFGTLAALCREAALFVGGDTGPLHLAHAVGAPVLCLIGPTLPERNGPYDQPERVVFHRLPCSGCYRRFDEAKACLLALGVDRVARRALELVTDPGPAPVRPEPTAAHIASGV